VRDPDNLVYMREEAGGLVIGGYEPNPLARWIDGVPWEHGGRALPGDYDRFEQLLEGAIRRIPYLENAEIVALINHPGAYVPDCQPIVGPMPGARGLWMACGMSLNGFGAAGGVGRLLASWIAGIEPDLDIYSFKATRFGDYYSSPYYAAERTRESVKYYYRLKFPNDENEWARPHRTSPVHFRLQELGAVFGEKYGWERVNFIDPGKPSRRMGADQREWGWTCPPYFERVGVEHKAVRERAGLFDLSSFGKIEVSGPGATALMQRVTDNDVVKPAGSVIYTQFLNPNGGMESDVTVTRLTEDRYRVITGSSFISNDLAWLRMSHRASDGVVKIQDVTMNYACLALWGPKARFVLQGVTNSDVSNPALPYMMAKDIEVRGFEVLAQRVSYVGELGWELYAPWERAVQLWDALIEAGAEHGLEVGGYKALDSLRLEKGYRYFTADITPLETPYEAGLGFCVKLEKGDFIGREALLETKAKGFEQKLCSMVLDGEAYIPVYGGEAVYLDGKVVSRIRSGGYGYSLQRNIAYAYLPVGQAKRGTQVEIEVFDKRVPAEVAQTVLLESEGSGIKG
jgi:glycine cleavage system T protein